MLVCLFLDILTAKSVRESPIKLNFRYSSPARHSFHRK